MISDKVRPHHLERKAILYVRQSSAHQSSALRRHVAAPSQDISGLLRSWRRTIDLRPIGRQGRFRSLHFSELLSLDPLEPSGDQLTWLQSD